MSAPDFHGLDAEALLASIEYQAATGRIAEDLGQFAEYAALELETGTPALKVAYDLAHAIHRILAVDHATEGHARAFADFLDADLDRLLSGPDGEVTA